jgi:hypothetical protein
MTYGRKPIKVKQVIVNHDILDNGKVINKEKYIKVEGNKENAKLRR